MGTIKTDSFLQKAIEQQIKEGELVTLCVTGKSMRPYLSGNGSEFIVVSRHQPEELKRGAIILFPYNNKYIFHRVISKIGNVFIVQGDGNCIQTEEVKLEDVLGIVRFIIRPGGEKVTTDGLSAQVYWRIWLFLRPIRKYLLKIMNDE